MANEVENLLVGTRGWAHKSWNGGFYPGDMPVEWQLDFYGQHFKAILLPQAEWQGWTKAHIEEFEVLHEPEYFFVVFEVSAFNDGVLPKLEAIKGWLRNKAFGVLGFHLSQAEMNALQSELEPLGYKLTSCASRPQLMGWSLESEFGVLTGEPLYLVRMNDHPMSQLKETVTPFLESLPHDYSGGFIFSIDEDVSTKHVTDLKLLLELLGY
ncbi:hypothetical protein [Hydrogenovibrio marinus]|uniref:DUF72 domain-containing protein n=1 Tax=Hydrogenovibrio marinus TaxID=28885 RepID=A0A066ZYB0_HYDMR|nr:hypothetical protein [Hydrogenovibrio marinus]KDN95336.1 hypothetical protein EI16_03275 [Hydrogenovibrio marinus]BBN59822.1 hypothetical protein HVMH_1416 [Hydrogenovibrio marinus]